MVDEPLIEQLDRIIDAIVARDDATAALRDPDLAALAKLAGDLRDYPGRGFTDRLRQQLQRRTAVTTTISSAVAYAARPGFTAVTPYVWVPDRRFADFLIRVFDAVETSVGEIPGHGTHRELRIGSSMLMIGERGAHPAAPARPTTFHVFVDQVDHVFAKAIAAGAKSFGEPADRPYGERSGFVEDPNGNHWYIATALGPGSFAHSLRTVTPYLHALDVAAYIAFLQRAFGAVQEELHESSPGIVPYARVRIGDAAIELGTREPRPSAYFLYVADADAMYERALSAGATSLAPPADRPGGDRIGFVQDPVGNHWYIARPGGV